MKMNSLDTIIKLHLIKYPAMEIGDIVKLIYQSEFGGGHLIENPRLSYEQILEELSGLPKVSDSALEDLGESLCRIYLGPLRAIFDNDPIIAGVLNAIFVESASLFKGNLQSYYEKLDILLNLIKNKELETLCIYEESYRWVSDYPFSEKYINSHKNAGCPMLRHSESYRAKYQPSYRVALNEFARYLALFEKFENMLKEKNCLIVAIDGNCGSGKSTLAKIISSVYNCPVIKMDDFFLPENLRTEERLTEPGGNVHYERFIEEVLLPLSQGKKIFSHKVFDCNTMAYASELKEILFSNIVVIEGSYSMRPEFRNTYDISIFLDATPPVQKSRILGRNGEINYKMFESRWIPMENRYFEHFNIADACDIVYKA